MYIMIRFIHISFAIVAITGACVLSTQADLKDPTLSVYYSFDEEDNTVKDGSPNGNDGTVEGGAKWEKGVIGSAIALAPNVWINMNGPEFKNGPEDGFTLAVWVNHTGTHRCQLRDFQPFSVAYKLCAFLLYVVPSRCIVNPFLCCSVSSITPL